MRAASGSCRLPCPDPSPLNPIPCLQGPLAGESFAFDKDIAVKEHHQHSQSAAFVVVHKPGASTRIAW